MAKRVLGLLLGVLLLACACEPAATPLPNILPTVPPPTSDSATATPAPLRYAIAPETLPYLPDADKSLIAASAQVISLDATPVASDLGARYDLVVALGDLPGGTRAPTPLQIDLLVNPSLAPLNDPALVDILRHAIDPKQIVTTLAIPGAQAATAQPSDSVTLRNQLANAGYPDGFDLTLASPSPADASALTQLLKGLGIDVHQAVSAANLTLASEPSPSANAIPLYTVPISYRAIAGLNITFTPSGFPIAGR